MKSRDKTVVLVVAFVALIAVVGLMTFNRQFVKKEEQSKIDETKDVKEEVQEYESQQANVDEVEAEIVEEAEPVVIEEAAQPSAPVQELHFSEEEEILWPVEGDVILNYSMDQPVYFATLDQYKYNPALIISGEVGKPVVAAADGRITEIRKDPQLGNVISMDLGNGYSVTYGQLEDIRGTEGQKIEQGKVIGYLAEPTKYYAVEGCNLYFQMMRGEESVNPMEFLE